MKLYEINAAIAQLMDQLDVDTETGKVGENYDAVMVQIHALDMERTSILQYLAKIVLNTRAEAVMLKAEVKKLINSGVSVPGCAVVEDYSCSLK